MGKGKIRITAELLMQHLLLLEGYELVDVSVNRIDGKVDVLELNVASEHLPDDKLNDVSPRYRKIDYELEKIRID